MFIAKETIYEYSTKSNDFEVICVKYCELGSWYNIITSKNKEFEEDCKKFGYNDPNDVYQIIVPQIGNAEAIPSIEYYNKIYPIPENLKDKIKKENSIRYSDMEILNYRQGW